MEAIGAASAILAVIELGLKLTSRVYRSYETVKDARSTQARITREMRDLVKILEQLLDIVSEPGQTSPASRSHAQTLKEVLTQKDNPLQSCLVEMKEVDRILDTRISLVPRSLEKKDIFWLLKKKDIDKHLDRVRSCREQLGFAVQTQSMATVLGVEKLMAQHYKTVESGIEAESNRTLLSWLKAPDVWSNLQSALRKRQPGTGEWFLKSPEYRFWRATPQFLWLSGIPGCGKTVLSATVTSALLYEEQMTENAVVYSYFDFQDATHQQEGAPLRSILKQLAQQSASALQNLRQLQEKCNQRLNKEFSVEELLEAVKSSLSGHPRTFIVIDALDECHDRKDLLYILKQLFEVGNVHILAMSRKEKDIEIAFQGLATEFPLERMEVDADISSHIRHRMETSQYMKEWSEEVKNKVAKRLNDEAGGMFRWVQCQLDALEQCSDSEEINEALSTLPRDLPTTYERVLTRLDKRTARNVKIVLTSLAFAHRPLSKDELSNILQVDPLGTPKIRNSDIYWTRLLIALSSLVNVVASKEGNVLRLAHFTVKEYLVSQHIRKGDAQYFATTVKEGTRTMAEICLGCLLHHDKIDSFGRDTLARFPFTLYAALAWSHHAKDVNDFDDRGSMDDLIFELFTENWDAYVNWHRITGAQGPDSPVNGLDMNRHMYEGKPASRATLLDRHRIYRPLFYAAKWNLWRITERLLLAGHKADEWNRGNKTALHPAAQARAIEAASKLLTIGKANINSGDWIGDTPLHYSINVHDHFMVEWLLQQGAATSKSSKQHGLPLQMASFQGQKEAVSILLKYKADPSTVCEHFHDEQVDLATSLQCAAYSGSIECMQLLLENGAKINQIEGRMGTAINAAAVGGQLDALKWLHAQGADLSISSPSRYGRAIWAAAYGGNTLLVEYLLDVQPPITGFKDVVGRFPDVWDGLANSEREGIVKNLIDQAVKRFCADILEAATRGLTSIVEDMLNDGQNIDQRKFVHNRSPLTWAAAKGHLDTVKLLLRRGANTETFSRGAETPLEAACAGGHLEVVKCLLAYKAVANFRQHGKYRTAMVCAELSGNSELLVFLKNLETQEPKEFLFEGNVYELSAHDRRFHLKSS